MNIPTAELTPSQLDQLDHAREILIKHVGEFICQHHGLEDLASHTKQRRFRNRWVEIDSSSRYWGVLAIQFRQAHIKRSVIAWASQWDLDPDERDVLSQLAGFSVFFGFDDPPKAIAEAQQARLECSCVGPYECSASCPIFGPGGPRDRSRSLGFGRWSETKKSYTIEQIEHLSTDIVRQKMENTFRRPPTLEELGRVLMTIRAGRVPEDVLRRGIEWDRLPPSPEEALDGQDG